MTYKELGTYIDNGKEKNEVAQRKYGENHSKMATLLDLAVISRSDNTYLVSLSVFGAAYNRRNDSEKKKLAARLLFRVPIIQKVLIDALSFNVNILDELSCLSNKTKTRRKPNIVFLLKFISNELEAEDVTLRKALNGIKVIKCLQHIHIADSYETGHDDPK